MASYNCYNCASTQQGPPTSTPDGSLKCAACGSNFIEILGQSNAAEAQSSLQDVRSNNNSRRQSPALGPQQQQPPPHTVTATRVFTAPNGTTTVIMSNTFVVNDEDADETAAPENDDSMMNSNDPSRGGSNNSSTASSAPSSTTPPRSTHRRDRDESDRHHRPRHHRRSRFPPLNRLFQGLQTLGGGGGLVGGAGMIHPDGGVSIFSDFSQGDDNLDEVLHRIFMESMDMDGGRGGGGAHNATAPIVLESLPRMTCDEAAQKTADRSEPTTIGGSSSGGEEEERAEDAQPNLTNIVVGGECPICQEAFHRHHGCSNNNDNSDSVARHGHNNDNGLSSSQAQNTLEMCVELPCQHIYHEKCIGQWLSHHNSCPSCRFQLATERDLL